MKQKHYIAGLYYRLSQEDERQGESVSIDNQRTILRKYAEERGFEIHDEYIDDGVSGTTFQRPEVQRLLDDAKTGVINTIIVKDLSRFGRNYIEVGQYVDYVFPAFGIRFIAIQDNVDTENRDSGAMEMMPIMNVFNEWHAANTSKKIRAVKRTHTQLYTCVALSELNKYVVANEDGIARFKVKFTFSEWTSFKLFETTQSSTEIMFVGLDVGWSGILFTFELDTINKTLKVTQPDGTDKVYSITSTNVSDYAFMRTGEKTFDIEVVNL